jgi:two-component system response regulator YesN
VLLSLKNEVVESKRSQQAKKTNELQYYYMIFFDYLTGKDLFFDYLQFSKSIGLNFIHPCFKTALFSFGSDNAAKQCKKPIDELLFNEGIRHISFTCGRGILLVVLNIPTQVDAACNAALTKSASLVQSAAIGVSMALEGNHELKNAYRQAEQALKECHFKGAKIQIFNDALKKVKNALFSIEDNMNIVNLLKNGTKTELDDALKSIFNKASQEDINISDMENYIIATLGFIHIHTNLEYPGLFDIRSSVDGIFGRSTSIFSVKIALKEFFYDLYDNINKQRCSDKTRQMTDKITEYISQNYNKELSLHDMSTEIGINYSYLSSLFASTFQISFSEYVTGVRMEKACSMLKNTRMKVHEIAESCGYPDSKYFFRVFKKRFGVTPEVFRGWNAVQ